MKHKIICGDAVEELKQFEDNSIDSCVCDPPYNLTSISKRFQHSNRENENYAMVANHGYGRMLRASMGGFMGKEWDGTGISFKVELWQELYRVLKPGAHILVAGIARTHHRMWVALEDAGFEIRDGIYHVFGSGFPKSTDISKQLDKMAGVEHPIGKKINENIAMSGGNYTRSKMEVQSEEAIKWNGFGTALKPAVEIWCLARKPISERNIAANVLKWGCGGINIDGCRIGAEQIKTQGGDKFKGDNIYGKYNTCKESSHQGRFPANLILDSSDEVAELFPMTISKPHRHNHIKETIIYGNGKGLGIRDDESNYDDFGSAARFFYQAKASQNERWFYCTICKQAYPMKERDNHIHNALDNEKYKHLEPHPTQKPLQLIQYLTRLITPPHGTVLDPFMGTGTTLVAAEQEGFNSIGVDSKLEYCRIAERRLKNELIQLKINQERSTIEKTGF